MQVKALACALPATHGVPLSRWSRADLARHVQETGLVGSISGSTIWRWLSQDALRPWRYRSWLFPRDPEFLPKAERLLDLYAGVWEGQPLTPHDHVLCADEKTSIQARRRCHPSAAPTARRVRRVEHEYERGGALASLAAWDVRHARVFGRCEARSGIAAFDRLVADVMSREPYCSAARVFWVLDNGSAHRGARAVERLRRFQTRYEQLARPFEWKFTRQDLVNVLARYAELHEAAA